MITKPRSPILAAFLSFLLPELGQLYAGRLARALAFAAIGSAALLLLGTFIHSGNLIGSIWTEVLLGTLFSAIAIVDAWIAAKRAPAEYALTECNRTSTYLWFVALALGCSLAIGLLEARRMQDHMRTFQIAGNAMNPTLVNGDFIFVDHQPYLKDDPLVGELVIFRSPENRAQHWTSRIVALGGQTVGIRDGALLVDGAPVAKNSTDNTTTETLGDFTYEVVGMAALKDVPPVTVPQHQVFLLSDNRRNSADSRRYGAVSVSAINGKLSHRYFPRTRMGPLNEPSTD